MRMYESACIAKRYLAVLLCALALQAGAAGDVLAAETGPGSDASAVREPTVVGDQSLAADVAFSSPIEAYRQGKAAFDEGWYGLALPALRYAADRGVFGARLKVAKMYELGLGVPRNDREAFQLYRALTENNLDLSNFHPAAPYIGQSLSALGVYYLNGIEAIGLKPDPREAAALFTRAGEYFGDPRAQYELAKLYLAGDGVKKDPKRAVAWLSNAARKDHAPAQAMLGQILWEGEIVPQRRLRALVLLTLARDNAAPQDSEWIGSLYNTIVADSKPQDITRAKAAVARWVRVYQPNNGRARIVIQKEVRIGIAEDRDAADAASVMGDDAPLPPAVAGESDPRPDDRDRRMWTGASTFQEIDR